MLSREYIRNLVSVLHALVIVVILYGVDALLLLVFGRSYWATFPRLELFFFATPALGTLCGLILHRRGAITASRPFLLLGLVLGCFDLGYTLLYSLASMNNGHVSWPLILVSVFWTVVVLVNFRAIFKTRHRT
jgi:hypothetical protein